MLKLNLDPVDIEFVLNNFNRLSSAKIATLLNVKVSAVTKVINKVRSETKRRNYTDREIVSAALKFTTIKDFRKKNRDMCNEARKRGILTDLQRDGHFEILGNMKNKFVYVYFLTNNEVYVGQTCNLKNRDKQHGLKLLKNKTVVKKLESKLLCVTRATKLEEALRQRYIKLKYKVLNKVPCFSVGGSFLKWTKENCLLDSKKYTSRYSWKKNSSGAYYSARINGWLEECASHFINRKLNRK